MAVTVAPLAGAWIEIVVSSLRTVVDSVAPLAGAWIEMKNLSGIAQISGVAPLAGAWIEICINMKEIVY